MELKVGDFVRYSGPKRTGITRGEGLRITAIKSGRAHCSNLNQPFCGCFVGWVDIAHLQRCTVANRPWSSQNLTSGEAQKLANSEEFTLFCENNHGACYWNRRDGRILWVSDDGQSNISTPSASFTL